MSTAPRTEGNLAVDSARRPRIIPRRRGSWPFRRSRISPSRSSRAASKFSPVIASSGEAQPKPLDTVPGLDTQKNHLCLAYVLVGDAVGMLQRQSEACGGGSPYLHVFAASRMASTRISGPSTRGSQQGSPVSFSILAAHPGYLLPRHTLMVHADGDNLFS